MRASLFVALSFAGALALAGSASAGKGIVKGINTPTGGTTSIGAAYGGSANGAACGNAGMMGNSQMGPGMMGAGATGQTCPQQMGGAHTNPMMAIKSQGVPDGGPGPTPKPTPTPCAPYPGRPCPH